MPIVVQSPMAAAANTAASFLQGQTEASLRNRAAALAQQKQDSEDRLQAAQAQMYLGHGAEFLAQGNQRDALTPALVARMEAQGYKLRADGNYENLKGEIVLPAQAALMAAQANNQNSFVPLHAAEANANNALVPLRAAQTQVQLQGELPLLKSKTAYTNSLPGYNASKIMAMNNATNSRAFSSAQSTAARIQVAGMDEAGRLVLGQMVNDRVANGDSEKEAMQGALAQYRMESQSYAQQMGANNKATAAGQQQPYPNAKPPTLQQPNVSQGGVTLNLSLPSQGVSTGANGQPVYTQQPTRTINVQGEVTALKNALNSPNHDQSKVMQIFNGRTDLTPQQKALIGTSAGAPNPQSPGAFQMPLGKPAAPAGGMFSLPTSFSLPPPGGSP